MKKSLAIIFCLLFSSNLLAKFQCSVTLKHIIVYDNGNVSVYHTGRNLWTFICNLNGEWKNVNTVTCAMWTSMLQNIQQNNQEALFYYSGEGSCATLPTYGDAPAPSYIGTTPLK
ncbi:MAG: hypothetical protein AAGB12_08445 [Pseudomonadota bacterium]